MFAVCTRCQAALAENELEGLCPRCLIQQALPPLERIEGAATTPPAAFVPPSPADLAPLFPQLEVLELLGQGGMGAVYKARQVKLDRLVALKVLPPTVAEGPGFAERFAREARALARLNHPHVVAVYDFGDAQGLYYLVMEYVDGVNLRQALAAGQVAPPQALALVGQLCAALQYAHEMGVVHRDVKPENVLLDRHGRVKVADFGLAKLVGAERPTRLTGTGQAMGTPNYMAPEQWERPLEVDHRADIYSLGVVFYELLTGELPLGKFAPPSAKPGVDARLDGVVLRAMERRPEQRYQQMSELKTAVESFEKAPPTPPAPPLDPAVEIGITVGMVAGIGGLVGVMWALRPYLVVETLSTWSAFGLFCLVFLWHPTHRYLQRFWGVAVLIVTACFIVSELAGVNSPFMFKLTAWFMLPMIILLVPLAVTRLVASFRHAETPAAPAAPAPPVPGLSAREEALRQVLLKAAVGGLYGVLSVLPEIDSELLATVRRACQAAPADRVLGVLDFTGEGDGEAALVFGCDGVYWHNADHTSHPGTGSASYPDLAGRRFVNHGDAVFLGGDQYLCPDEEESGTSAEALTSLLYEVREVMATGAPLTAPAP